MTTCKSCGVSLPDRQLAYVGMPACDCCGQKGQGYIYHIYSKLSFCQACSDMNGKTNEQKMREFLKELRDYDFEPSLDVDSDRLKK